MFAGYGGEFKGDTLERMLGRKGSQNPVRVHVWRPPSLLAQSITARVLDDKGWPVEGASVNLRYRLSDRVIRTETTDSRGLVSFLGLAREGAKYTVHVLHAGRQVAEHVERLPDRCAEVTVAMVSQVDLSGRWTATYTDPYQTADIEWTIRRGRHGWLVTQKMSGSTHPYWNQKTPCPFHDMTLSDDGRGGIKFEGRGNDGNPGNSGNYTQKGTGSYTPLTISLDGEHKGARITHWARYKATRVESR